MEQITAEIYKECREKKDIQADLKRFGLRTFGLLWGGVWNVKFYKDDKDGELLIDSTHTWPAVFNGEGDCIGLDGGFSTLPEYPMGFQGKSITIAYYRSDVDAWSNPQANSNGGYSHLEWTSLVGDKTYGYEHLVPSLGDKPIEIIIEGQFSDYDNFIINYKRTDGLNIHAILKRVSYAWLPEELEAELSRRKSKLD